MDLSAVTVTETKTEKPYRVGCLMSGAVQFLDTAPIDLFGMMTPSYIRACKFPKPLQDQTVDIEILYISEESPYATMTASAGLRVTHELSSPDCAPGTLDVLLIPGPDPSAIPSDAVKEFVRGHDRVEKTNILTICTGIYVAGYAGILDGKTATGPRAILGDLSKKFPNVNWVEKRWTRDGKNWNSAGITNGLDMTAAFIQKKWPTELSKCVIAMAEVGDRGIEYNEGKIANTSWWIWQILSAAIWGKRK